VHLTNLPIQDEDTGIVFTATRVVTPRGVAVMRRTLTMIERGFIHAPGVTFITGAAMGGDTYLALACLFRFQERKHLVCIPDYEHNYILVDALRQWQPTFTCPKLTVVDTGLPPLDRNGYMLDRGHILFAFPSVEHEQRRGSGTWACIRWARKRNMPILISPLSGTTPWVEGPIGLVA